MAKRGSFSISAAAHAKVKAYCKANGLKVGPLIEERLDIFFLGIDQPDAVTPEQRMADLEARVQDLEFRARDVP